MEFIKVDHKILGPGGGNVLFGMDSDAGVIILIGVEQC